MGILLRPSNVEMTVKSITRKGIRVAIVAGLVATGLVGVTSLTASANPPIPYGTLTIVLTDRAGSLTVRNSIGTPLFTQGIAVGTPCSQLTTGSIVPTPASGSTLLKFSAKVLNGSAPNVQLPSNGIGVTDGANCGVRSGLVGPGETLTLALGDALPPGVMISTGKLQIGKSGDNDGNLQVTYDGAQFTPTTPVIEVTPAGGVREINVGVANSTFTSISIRSTASQSSRGLSLRSTTEFTLVRPADATVPSAPTGVTALRGDAQATVSWGVPSNGGSPINGYAIRYYPTGSPGSATTVTVDAATTSQPVSPLANGTPYTFEVRANNGVGESAPGSTTATPATVPSAPTGVNASGGNAQATVSWGVPSNGGSPINGYAIRYYPTGSPGSATTVTVDAATTTRTVSPLINGTQYTFEVRANNTVGESAPGSTTATPWTDPLVQCGETVPAGGTGSIANSAVFFRGENGSKAAGSTCADVGVVIEIQAGNNATDPGRVFWNNSNIGLDGLKQDVQGTVTIEWAPVDPAAPGNLAREIDYDADGIGNYTSVLWCKSFSKSTNIQTGKVTFTAEQPLLPSGTPGANADGTAPWCLVSNVETLTNGQITQTQVYYGSGDPWAR